LVAEPITGLAPFILAICRPISPTPELAPWISTLSPALRRPCVISALCSVCSATGSTAACSKPKPAGNGSVRPWSDTAYSAYPPEIGRASCRERVYGGGGG